MSAPAFEQKFDGFANTYHNGRPPYPAALFADLRQYCGLDKNSRLLEIGAGSGIATVDLAKLGAQIIALEPGPSLAAIARQQTRKMKNVTVVEKPFEAFRSAKKFDALCAFTSFHWIDPAKKFPAAARLLKDDGFLVLVWHYFMLVDSPAMRAVERVYTKDMPCPKEPASTLKINGMDLKKIRERQSEILHSEFFTLDFQRNYLTRVSYTPERYCALLNSFPDTANLTEPQRQRFFDALTRAISKHGGVLDSCVLTGLTVCRKNDYYLNLASPKR